MSANLSAHKKLIISVSSLIFVGAILVTSRTYYEKRLSIQLSQNTSAITEDYWIAVEKMKTAYENRSKYLLSFLKSGTKLSQDRKVLIDTLAKLNQLELKQQSDFQKFDKLASYLNELIVREVLLSRKNKFAKRSLNGFTYSFFSGETDIRMLERYDLSIDRSRKHLAEMAWQANLATVQNQKLIFVRANLNALPYFEIDRMVLRKQL